MENRHIKTLLRLFVGPFIKNCPPQLFERLLGPLLPNIFNLLLERLDAGT